MNTYKQINWRLATATLFFLLFCPAANALTGCGEKTVYWGTKAVCSAILYSAENNAIVTGKPRFGFEGDFSAVCKNNNWEMKHSKCGASPYEQHVGKKLQIIILQDGLPKEFSAFVDSNEVPHIYVATTVRGIRGSHTTTTTNVVGDTYEESAISAKLTGDGLLVGSTFKKWPEWTEKPNTISSESKKSE